MEIDFLHACKELKRRSMNLKINLVDSKIINIETNFFVKMEKVKFSLQLLSTKIF